MEVWRLSLLFALGLMGMAIVIHFDSLVDVNHVDTLLSWAQVCQKQAWSYLIPSALYCSLCRTAQLDGQVGDCSCDFDTVDAATHDYFRPLLAELQQTTFFRYFKVGLDEECPFWDQSSEICALKDCSVETCEPEEVPAPWRASDENETGLMHLPTSGAKASDDLGFSLSSESSGCVPEWVRSRDGPVGSEGAFLKEGQLGRVSRSQSGEPGSENLRPWSEGDDDSELWIAQPKDDTHSVYVDLLANPERFTGYVGDSPHKIWQAIYEENCFEEAGQCLEKRVFYRVLSGLQSSITTHIAKGYYYGAKGSFGDDDGYWGPNTELFVERVGKHPDRLHNLYFVYLFLLRALAKAAPELEAFDYSTGGDPADDARAKALVRALTNPDHPLVDASKDAQVCQRGFDESRLFQSSTIAPEANPTRFLPSFASSTSPSFFSSPSSSSSRGSGGGEAEGGSRARSLDANTAFEEQAMVMDGSFERFDDFMKAASSAASKAAAAAAEAVVAAAAVPGPGASAETAPRREAAAAEPLLPSAPRSGSDSGRSAAAAAVATAAEAAASVAAAQSAAAASDASSALRLAAAEGAVALRGEFQGRFRNISRIMDCVGCERCRLWGKLQVLGLGTALKILMSPDALASSPATSTTGYSLQRNEIIALLNTLGQVSASVSSVNEWRRRELQMALAQLVLRLALLVSLPVIGKLFLVARRRRQATKPAT